MPRPSFDLLVFGLGGVLVENVGMDRLLTWMSTKPSAEELWHTWLMSPTVRAFESGILPAVPFAEAVIAELSLPLSPEEFLTDFAGWTKQLYPGALELLQRLSQSHRLDPVRERAAASLGRRGISQ